MQSLQSHPGEGDQQEVVQEEGCGNTQAYSIFVQRQPWVQQEYQVQQEQAETQMDQDFWRDVMAEFSEMKQKKWVNKGSLGIDFRINFILEEVFEGSVMINLILGPINTEREDITHSNAR